jgi:hypothetical protein
MKIIVNVNRDELWPISTIMNGTKVFNAMQIKLRKLK